MRTFLDFDPEKIPRLGETANCNYKGVAVNCGPHGLPPGRCYLYRNNGDGTFTDVGKRVWITKIPLSYCMTTVVANR